MDLSELLLGKMVRFCIENPDLKGEVHSFCV